MEFISLRNASFAQLDRYLNRENILSPQNFSSRIIRVSSNHRISIYEAYTSLLALIQKTTSPHILIRLHSLADRVCSCVQITTLSPEVLNAHNIALQKLWDPLYFGFKRGSLIDPNQHVRKTLDDALKVKREALLTRFPTDQIDNYHVSEQIHSSDQTKIYYTLPTSSETDRLYEVKDDDQLHRYGFKELFSFQTVGESCFLMKKNTAPDLHYYQLFLPKSKYSIAPFEQVETDSTTQKVLKISSNVVGRDRFDDKGILFKIVFEEKKNSE